MKILYKDYEIEKKKDETMVSITLSKVDEEESDENGLETYELTESELESN